MKILIILTQDLESPSGLGRYWPIARALTEKGHEVRIAGLHSNWTALKEKKFIRENVSIEYVAPMHVMKAGNQKKYYSSLRLVIVTLWATIKLISAALSKTADIIYIGKPHPMNGIAGILASRIKGSVLCLDCDDYEAGSNRFNKSWQKNMVVIFEKNIPNFTALVTTNTHFMKEKLINWGYPSEKIYYLPNGIDQDRFKPNHQVDVLQLRTQLGLDGKRVVLYLGSISLVNHPVDILLRAFTAVVQQCPEAVLLIVGGGEDLQKLKNQAQALEISQYVIFTGRIEPSEVPFYYSLSDVSVDPVKEDPAARGRSPLKLFESWVCGVPFVTSPVGDRALLLGQPPAGVLLDPPGDPAAIADGILQVLNSRDFSDELIQRGLERVQAYDWDRLSVKLEHEFQKLL